MEKAVHDEAALTCDGAENGTTANTDGAALNDNGHANEDADDTVDHVDDVLAESASGGSEAQDPSDASSGASKSTAVDIIMNDFQPRDSNNTESTEAATSSNNDDGDDSNISSTTHHIPVQEDDGDRRHSITTIATSNNSNPKRRFSNESTTPLPGRRVSYADSVCGSTEDSTHTGGTGGKSSSRSSVVSRRSSSFTEGIWTRLNRKSEVWEMDSLISMEDEDVLNVKECVVNNLTNTGLWLESTFKTAFTTPSVLIPCTLLFVTLSVCGLLIVYGFDNAEAERRKQHAIAVAEQTDLFFVRVLERAFVPLFTMAQFIQELPEFHELDLKVGDRCDPMEDSLNCTNSSSAPVKIGQEATHRNLTQLFSTEYGQMIQRKFDSIASGIKENSGLGKSLVNIQLAPKGVVSMLYPMVNCQDFDNGYCMDNSGAWGHDLLNDPERVGIARATVPAKKVVTAGPLPLIQGGDTFIARLAINFDEGGHSMVIDGVNYSCWGFAVVLIDWKRLKEESDIYHSFEEQKMQFKLTRTDDMNSEEVVKTIAESSESELIKNDNVKLDLNTGDNGWVISVGYDDGFSPNYKAWAYPIVFVFNFMFSLTMMLVLVSKKEHEKILGKLLPPRVIKKLRKGQTVVERYKMVTIFFSDIVGYTKMSSEMTPAEVMKMLNDLYVKFDELAEKHKIFKVETIGDAYIAIGGAPKTCPGPEAAERVALFALAVIEMVKNFRTDAGEQVFIRAGLATGPCVAGVVGTSLPKYTIFGDTV